MLFDEKCMIGFVKQRGAIMYFPQQNVPIPPDALTPIGTRAPKQMERPYGPTPVMEQRQPPPIGRVSQFARAQQTPNFNPNFQQTQPTQRAPLFVPFQQQQQAVKNDNFAQQGEQTWGFNLQRAAINPFDVLGIPRNTTEESIVDDVFRKWALILHPDRGGDPNKLNEIKVAYDKIKEILAHNRHESFDMLKRRAEHDIANTHLLNGGFQVGKFEGLFFVFRLYNCL